MYYTILAYNKGEWTEQLSDSDLDVVEQHLRVAYSEEDPATIIRTDGSKETIADYIEKLNRLYPRRYDETRDLIADFGYDVVTAVKLPMLFAPRDDNKVQHVIGIFKRSERNSGKDLAGKISLDELIRYEMDSPMIGLHFKDVAAIDTFIDLLSQLRKEYVTNRD